MEKKYQTKTGKAILGFIEEKKENSFSVSDLDAYLKAREMNVNITTIYRNLDKLTKEGTIAKFKGASTESYLYRVVGREKNCREHLHLQCRCCGKIYHLDGQFMQEIMQYMKEQFAFELECEKSSLSGLCSICKNKADKEVNYETKKE